MTFLDSHCEANVGWLEPILDIIGKDRKTVVLLCLRVSVLLFLLLPVCPATHRIWPINNDSIATTELCAR